MKVFISHSKPRSLALAQTLDSFFRKVVQGTEPWVSDSGIEKGERFMEAIRENLGQAVAGVVCLTSENLTEPWILWEAGALSTKVTDRVWTLLLDVDHTQVAAPFAGYNHTKAEKDDVWKLIKSIHNTVIAAKEKTCSERDLEDLFDTYWTKELSPKISELRAQTPSTDTKPDVQTETLGLVKELASRISVDSVRQEKTLAMLHVIYDATVGGAAPGLDKLRQVVSTLQAPPSTARALDGVAAQMGWQPQYAGTPLPMRASGPQRQQPSMVTVDPMIVGAPVVKKSESET